MTATDETAELVDDVVESVEEATGGRGLGLAFGAFLVGVGIGGGVAYLLATRRLETKYQKLADEEIAGMREHYQEKARALESQARKRPVEELVQEKGYVSPDAKTTSPPMAVQPPSDVVASEDERAGEPDKEPEPEVRNIFRDRHPEPEPVEHEWDLQAELRKRSPDIPYVIHIDERDEMEGYEVVTVTYYDGDDVMCNDRDDIIDHDDRERLIGEKNLMRFGHGSEDPSIVYVRNDKLEMIYEVVRSPNSYAEEVQGFRHDSGYAGNVERMRSRERDEPEE